MVKTGKLSLASSVLSRSPWCFMRPPFREHRGDNAGRELARRHGNPNILPVHARAFRKVGETVVVTIRRGRELKELTVTLEALDDQ